MRKLFITVGALGLALSGAVGAQSQARPASTTGAAQGSSATSAAPTTGGASGGQSASAGSVAQAGNGSNAAALAKIDPAKEADIRHLLDVVGTRSLMQQVMDNMVLALKPTMTNSLPPGDYRETLIDLFFEKFRSKFDIKTMLDMAVMRYDENLSDEEVRGLIDFYQTPLGKKVVTVLPKITSEMQQDGQKLGERMGRESMMEVLSEHPELRKAIQDAARGRSGDAR